ncbi:MULTISPECIES: response regulator [unclassified Bradyrhizobium]|uniref:response regulator n=1 Tax=unclassified Bradyrhizobium TaxID=2631580 RepID=UPI0015CA5E22|nr:MULTISPECIES: response regulator [unclassified Bradyrhizobium]MBB4261424.1 DNA-binding response OmpR family regulator [Bradyrhizobium sp. CIR3A]NYG47674.1 DNA-binding response OmpR family regulator [Bradyrhizobium sp. IAR9]
MQAANVLLVEQDVLVRHPLAEYLRKCGYRVVEVTDHDEARECFEGGKHYIDVALIDAGSPTGSGFALSAWIRSNHPTVRTMLGATVGKVLALAGDLCEEGPQAAKKLNYRPVLDHIRQLLATRKGS